MQEKVFKFNATVKGISYYEYEDTLELDTAIAEMETTLQERIKAAMDFVDGNTDIIHVEVEVK